MCSFTGVVFFYASSLIGDQCFWGKQLGELGLGPAKPLRVSLLNEQTLISQLREVLDSPKVLEAAKAFGSYFLVQMFCFFTCASEGARLREEDGTSKTVELLERLFAWMSPRRPLNMLWNSPNPAVYCDECGAERGLFFNSARRCACCGKHACSACLVTKVGVPNRVGECLVCQSCKNAVGLNGTTDSFKS